MVQWNLRLYEPQSRREFKGKTYIYHASFFAAFLQFESMRRESGHFQTKRPLTVTGTITARLGCSKDKTKFSKTKPQNLSTRYRGIPLLQPLPASASSLPPHPSAYAHSTRQPACYDPPPTTADKKASFRQQNTRDITHFQDART